MIKRTYKKHFLQVMVALAVSLAFISCSKTIRFENSTVVPGANASVSLSKDNNKNNLIEMTVTNLADPAKLTPPKKTFVVWMETKNDGIKNIGQLISETSYFSSARKATLKAVTPFKPLRFFVTAENNANIQYPGPQLVLTTSEFK